MTPEQLHQIDQARRYAEQDEYVVTRTHIRNLLAIIGGLDVGASFCWNSPDMPPKGKTGCWTREVVVMTRDGIPFAESYFNGDSGGVWQRSSARAALGQGGDIVAWAHIPELS